MASWRGREVTQSRECWEITKRGHLRLNRPASGIGVCQSLYLAGAKRMGSRQHFMGRRVNYLGLRKQKYRYCILNPLPVKGRVRIRTVKTRHRGLEPWGRPRGAFLPPGEASDESRCQGLYEREAREAPRCNRTLPTNTAHGREWGSM